jgi:hypothetical protein
MRSYRTGVDHEDICGKGCSALPIRLSPGDKVKARLAESVGNGFTFKLIEFAAQGIKSGGGHLS